MAGKRSPDYTDFITPRGLYRLNVTEIDEGPVPTSSSSGGSASSSSSGTGEIPILDTRPGPNSPVGLAQGDVNQYGRNAQIDLFTIVKGFDTVVLQLWLKAEIEKKEAYSGSPPIPPAIELPQTEDWVKMAEKTFTVSSGWVITDIPPGQYRVVLADAVGSGAVTILEQHAA